MDKRGSGILLHISSLPSTYGIGDLGPWAYRFTDFLAGAKQRYWQILPLNPTDERHGNSPYHSSSAFASNAILISPEFLLREGWLREEDMEASTDFPEDRVDYGAVIPCKKRMVHRA